MSDFPPDASSPEEDEQPIQPMQPFESLSLQREQRAVPLKRREPIPDILERIKELAGTVPSETDTAESDTDDRLGYREVDPLFAYLFLISLSIGLSTFDPLIRYILLWSLMGGLGMMGYLFGVVEHVRETKLEDVFLGLLFGALASLPFLIVFGSSLATVSTRMFDIENTPTVVMDTWVFMAVIFIIPGTETLFFRGAVQQVRGIIITTILSALWVSVLFFPNMELAGREVIALILLIVFSLLNFMYSYVQHRNGLVSAWLCQVASYGLLWFMPRILF